MSVRECESKRERKESQRDIEKTTFKYNNIKIEAERYLNMKIEEERGRATERVFERVGVRERASG